MEELRTIESLVGGKKQKLLFDYLKNSFIEGQKEFSIDRIKGMFGFEKYRLINFLNPLESKGFIKFLSHKKIFKVISLDLDEKENVEGEKCLSQEKIK